MAVKISGSIRHLLSTVALLIIGIVLAAMILEGGASLLLLIWEVGGKMKEPLLAERAHTQYDELLGWVNSPNLVVQDMYGPGIRFATNSQSFRNDTDFETKVSPGFLRVICSGDSFTLGYGVSNTETWCHLLTILDPRLETVNMGQGGYGVDQTYLWYKRDGIKLDHHIHLFTFIGDDFHRMQSRKFLEYAKPLLMLEGSHIKVVNAPVPRGSYLVPWLTENTSLLHGLRSVRLLRGLYRRTFPSPKPHLELSEDQVRAIALAAFHELARINDQKESVFILAFLPIYTDYYENTSDQLRDFLRTEAKKIGILFLDLVPDFQKLDYKEIRKLYFMDTHGHYTKLGNQLVARLLYNKLKRQNILTPPVTQPDTNPGHIQP